MNGAPLRDGILFRLASTFLITAMSACVQQAAQYAPVGQIMVWRSGVALIPIVLYMVIRSEFPAAVKTKHPRVHVIRGVLGAFSMAMSFLSLAYLPLATAQALAFLAPVLVLPLAAHRLRETVSLGLILTVGAGFSGVLILLSEALALPGEGALIGIGAALCYAITMAFVRVHTKEMTATESAATIAFYFAITSTLCGLATLPFGWAPLTDGVWIWLCLAGLLGGMAHIASNEAVARAPVSTLAPFDFTALIWALGFDLVVLSQVPGLLGLVGIAVITFAALSVTFRR